MPGHDHASPACPVRDDCPARCLSAVLPTVIARLLCRAPLASFKPPCTVADVARLCRQRELAQIRGLGPRRIGLIQDCLTRARLL